MRSSFPCIFAFAALVGAPRAAVAPPPQSLAVAERKARGDTDGGAGRAPHAAMVIVGIGLVRAAAGARRKKRLGVTGAGAGCGGGRDVWPKPFPPGATRGTRVPGCAGGAEQVGRRAPAAKNAATEKRDYWGGGVGGSVQSAEADAVQGHDKGD